MRDSVCLELNYIRHAQIQSISRRNGAGNKKQELYDSCSLTRTGSKGVRQLARGLIKDIQEGQTIILISSPIRRAIQTMQIIKKEFTKNHIQIYKEMTLNVLESARGLDELKQNYPTLNGNDLFDKWINGTVKLLGLEPYNKVKSRFIRFLKYILKMKKMDKKIKIIAVAHAELPDYLMVKFFNKYGLGNVELFNMYFNDNNEVSLSIKKRLNIGTLIESEKVITEINKILE